MADPFDVAGGTIRRVLGETVVYTGAGLASAPVRAVYANEAAEGGVRRITFDIDVDDLPQPPKKTDRIVRRGATFVPIAIVHDDIADSWLLTVERRAA